MAEITPGSILDRVVQEIPAFFRDGIDQVVTGEGEYIRSGEPEGTVGKIGQAVARSYCRQYGANPGAAKFGNAARIENACRPYLDDIDPGKGAVIAIPFEGGQCSGVLYGVTGGGSTPIFNCSGTQGNTRFGQSVLGLTDLVGPIKSISLVLTRPTNCGFGAVDVRVVDATNVPQQARITGPVLSGDAYLLVGGIVGVLRRLDDLPDDCGDPPPVVTQPEPISDPTGPDFRFNPNTFIDINVEVNIDVDGSINVGIGGPTVNVDPFGGGDDSGGGGGGPTAPPPGDIGGAGGASDTGDGGEAEGEAGVGEILVGLKIDILASPPKARQFAPGVFRGAGYIYMGVSGNLDQDYGGSMLKSGQFFFAEKDNLTHWLVSANNGYNWRVTPYYREVEG